MSHAVFILRRAQKELSDLPADIFDQAKRLIGSLAENPRPQGCLKLTGREGWRLRVGNYRIVYEIDDAAKTVTVLDIGHRRDIYR